MVETYKEGHGVLVRRVAFVALASLLFWGGLELYNWLSSGDWVRRNRWHDYRIPVINQYIDPAFAISWLVVIVGIVLMAFRVDRRLRMGPVQAALLLLSVAIIGYTLAGSAPSTLASLGKIFAGLGGR